MLVIDDCNWPNIREPNQGPNSFTMADELMEIKKTLHICFLFTDIHLLNVWKLIV